ncbi:MAG TPA: response regulator [Kofleriaceae bacterium]|jgi:CheY-like chemotaxis protein|nr:response regulator [Kofleriaceae bacterium]
MRVLIVDDYPDTAESASELLRRAGHDCQSATCGAEALAVADAFMPELAILDIGLPDIDGYALREALHSRLASPPYFVALSGRPHALNAALVVGFDACLLKPVGLAQLLRVVRLAQFEIHGSPMGKIVLERAEQRPAG